MPIGISRAETELSWKGIPIESVDGWRPFADGAKQPDNVVLCVNRLGGITHLIELGLSVNAAMMTSEVEDIEAFFRSEVVFTALESIRSSKRDWLMLRGTFE